MTPKDIVKNFYESDLANDDTVVSRFFHEDCELHWNSSHGFMVLKYNDIVKFFEGTRKAYDNLRFHFSHILQDGHFVTSRHTLFANTIELPDEEIALAHFIAIWEVKDGKLYRCFEMSHQGDEEVINSNSYNEIKI